MGDVAGPVVAVGEVRTSLPTPDLGDVGTRPATQTKAIGVIYPPPDIRAIVDKTAQFVARNGMEFEKRILANEKNNLKFNFLLPNDPYNMYYKTKIAEFSDGDAGSKPPVGGIDVVIPDLQPEPKEAPAAAPVIPSTSTLEKPEDDQYTVQVPEGLTAVDLDVIKVVAQFVARNGKNFLTGLASREHSNPVFNFLKPTHSMFTFFTALCDAYSKVLMPPKDIIQKLERDADDRQVLLERCLKRLEWEKAREREEKEAADAAEKERLAMQMIDWHDFVVVETIDFHDDEDAELPPPMSLKDVIALNKARPFEQEEAEQPVTAEPGDVEEVEMDVVMDDEEMALVAEANQSKERAEVVKTMEEEDVPRKIVKDYKRVDRKEPAYDPTEYVVSPITGELIKISEMAEHMRVSLIDPRWKEQRDAMLAKIRETTKAQDEEISRNLVTLAKTRPDIFGSTQEEVSQAVQVSIKEKMMSGANRAVVWDGVTQSGQGLESQLKAITDSKQDRPDNPASRGTPHPLVGPSVPGQGGSMMPRPPFPGGRPMMPPPVRPPPPVIPRAHQRPMEPIMRPPPPMQAGLHPSNPPVVPMAQVRPGMPHPPPPIVRPSHPMAGPQPMTGGPQMPPPPLPPREHPPPMPAEEPEPKRQRLVEFVLQPEEDFLAEHGADSAKVRIQCPSIDGNEKLIGQMLLVEVASLSDSIGHLKSRLAGELGLPANKQKLAREGVGFVKDEFSLAHYNISEDVVLTLGVKERGGRKKDK
ncbi:hypothetical protein BSKO_08388 [Bryopsis sp. KO-2023]|nr:hypothetical protein BSKO_08388 [Bryopsis sp. KO-2023]